MKSESRNARVGLAVALAVLTLGVFAQCVTFEFDYFDDPLYITDNPIVQQGLTWEGLRYAFSSEAAPITDPLGLVSHMAVVQFFGVSAPAHHAVSLVFHLANVLLLYTLLNRLTGSLYRAAFVTAVFAVHPFQVENVVWISDRKDVLCAFFWLAAAHAYVGYAANPRRTRMAAVLPFYTLSLLAKPMAVTFPFVLLLLDAWPLKRAPIQLDALGKWIRLAAEKWLLFLMCIPAAALTWWMQRSGGAMTSVDELPLSLRLANAVSAYAMYVFKTIWPTDFGIFYPISIHGPSTEAVVAGAILLVGVSAVAFAWQDRHGALFTGWFWFVGMLVPVIGIVQVGNQAYADRYTYLPIVGLAIAVIWPVHDSFAETYRRYLRPIALALTLVLAVLGFRQAALWKTPEGIYLHTIAITPPNASVETNLGRYYLDQGREDEARLHLDRAAEIKVRTHLQYTLQRDPNDVEAHYDLGLLEMEAGNPDSAVENLSEALRLNDQDPRIPLALAKLALDLGDPTVAVTWADRAIALDYSLIAAHEYKGAALLRLGRNEEALAAMTEVIGLEPERTAARMNLANQLSRMERYEEAVTHYEAALKQSPNDPVIWFNAGIAHEMNGDIAQAAQHYDRALALNPDFSAAAQRRVNLPGF